MKKSISLILATAVILMMTACNKSDDLPVFPAGPGKMVIKITDDPFDIHNVESATVTISKIELRKSGVDEDSAYITLSEVPLTIDLLGLRNGVVQELVNHEIPSGRYDLIRLFIDMAQLKLRDNPEQFTVKIPSGPQTGIKIFVAPALLVETGLTSELLLDIDLSRSFVMRGNHGHSPVSNGFIFKPVLRAVNTTTSGRLEGYVSDTANLKIPNATVWISKDSVLATSFTDSLGYYAIIGVPEGTYSIFAAKEKFDTVRVDGIHIYRGNLTVQNFVLNGL